VARESVAQPPRQPTYQFLILGPLSVLRNGGELALPGRRPATLLAVLVVHANEHVSSDRLAEELWDGRPPPTARSALQMHVHALRGALGPSPPLRTVPGGYVLDVPPDGIDAAAFERSVARGGEALAAGSPHEACAALRDALSRWRGDALEGFADAGFARLEARRLEELRLGALELRFDAELSLGRHGEAVPELSRLVGSHPSRERFRAQLMLALYRSGRQADALLEYQHARRYLVDELGLEPGAELQTLQGAVLAQDHKLDLADAGQHRSTSGVDRRRTRLPAPPTPTVGRDADVDALRTLVCSGERRLTTVLGPGGVGKTRLAVEAARTLEGTRTDGVCFVSLGSLGDPGDVALALAQALDLPVTAADGLTNLIVRHLTPRDTLLVLDNFEHVLDAAPLVATILEQAPSVTVLATSREPLRLRAERIYPLAPLEVDGKAGDAAPETLARIPAVELFLDVVGAGDPRFSATPEDLEAIRRLCRCLDGLPLALELVAGRVGPQSVESIAAEVGNGPDLLARGPRDPVSRRCRPRWNGATTYSTTRNRGRCAVRPCSQAEPHCRRRALWRRHRQTCSTGWWPSSC
jgi:DNA-binding SARP family transcriptional activator